MTDKEYWLKRGRGSVKRKDCPLCGLVMSITASKLGVYHKCSHCNLYLKATVGNIIPHNYKKVGGKWVRKNTFGNWDL